MKDREKMREFRAASMISILTLTLMITTSSFRVVPPPPSRFLRFHREKIRPIRNSILTLPRRRRLRKAEVYENDENLLLVKETKNVTRSRGSRALRLFRKRKRVDKEEEIGIDEKYRAPNKRKAAFVVDAYDTKDVDDTESLEYMYDELRKLSTELEDDEVVEMYQKVQQDETRSKRLRSKVKSKVKSKISTFPISRRKKKPRVEVSNIHELRHAILHKGLELKDVAFVQPEPQSSPPPSEPHAVLSLIQHRILTKSKPSSRHPSDTARLALSIEGGGMRGAVSTGMSAAIACLGLLDAFDAIYGASAGSVVGAYMVSRQMCTDVYTDILPAAKTAFVSKLRILSSLVMTALSGATSRFLLPSSSNEIRGMNISFVLDGILSPTTGIRPLDIQTFQINDRRQPLRVVSSVVREDGGMETVCFGSDDGDFFDSIDPKTGRVIPATTCVDGTRHGLFACLEASMTVPGATGPPVKLTRTSGTIAAFDAFCYEPLPYRSAVEENATHVLVLRSRPEGCECQTSPGVYETTVAPLYFRAHKQPEVATYFENGGQQYRYLEDVLTLEEGRQKWNSTVLVPPTNILYGLNATSKTQTTAAPDLYYNSSNWKKAHLFPITKPQHKPELPTLEQGRNDVLQAVRDGFAAAYDTLAPYSEFYFQNDTGILDGERVAQLLFPNASDSSNVLNTPIFVQGDLILDEAMTGGDDKFTVNRRRWWRRIKFDRINVIKRIRKRRKRRQQVQLQEYYSDTSEGYSTWNDTMSFLQNSIDDDDDDEYHAKTLLNSLPGFQSGRLAHLAGGLHYHSNKTSIG